MFSLWDRIKYNFKGLDELAIKELQERVAELEKLSKNFEGLPEQVIELSNKFNDLPKDFTELLDKFDNLEKEFTGLSKTVTDHTSKLENLTEAVAEQEKVMLTCCIVASVVALAAIGFIGFCIYQGVKCEREKQKNLSQDTSGTEFNNPGELNTPGTKFDADGSTKLNNSVNGSKSLNDMAA